MLEIILFIIWIALGFNICLEYVEEFSQINTIINLFVFLLIMIFAPIILIASVIERMVQLLLDIDDDEKPPDSWFT